MRALKVGQHEKWENNTEYRKPPSLFIFCLKGYPLKRCWPVSLCLFTLCTRYKAWCFCTDFVAVCTDSVCCFVATFLNSKEGSCLTPSFCTPRVPCFTHSFILELFLSFFFSQQGLCMFLLYSDPPNPLSPLFPFLSSLLPFPCPRISSSSSPTGASDGWWLDG